MITHRVTKDNGFVDQSQPSNLLQEEVFLPEEVNTSEIFREGAVRQVSINAYERDPKARQRCILYYGTPYVS